MKIYVANFYFLKYLFIWLNNIWKRTVTREIHTHKYIFETERELVKREEKIEYRTTTTTKVIFIQSITKNNAIPL